MVEIPSRDGARFKPKACDRLQSGKKFYRFIRSNVILFHITATDHQMVQKIAIELILGASVVNAHQLFKLYKDDASKISITTFKENLCMQLLNHGIADIDTVPVSKHMHTHLLKKEDAASSATKNKEIHGRNTPSEKLDKSFQM
nr:unnamed protein product [Callosobruchus analis]